jgi:hypothetical protein
MAVLVAAGTPRFVSNALQSQDRLELKTEEWVSG